MPQPHLNPFLWYDGQAEDAARFYVSVFPDSQVVAITPGLDGKPLVVEFQLAGRTFYAMNGGPMFRFNEAVSFVIDCETQQEVDYYWSQLTEGGSPGDCGWLKDRFGLSWQVTPVQLLKLLRHPDSAKAGRVMAAMMTMTRLDIAALEAAAEAA